jgi:hypothetical protein
MAEAIYPSGKPRTNYAVRMYCEIAMEAYYDATKLYDKICQADFDWDLLDERNAMEKKIVKTIVFSAMCIEAFLNDYAAACLGDSDFYDNFDRLSTMSKFELIARFILCTEIEKDKSYYYHIKKLIKQRDSYVHSKSHAVEYNTMSEDEWEEFHAHLLACEPEEAPRLDKHEIDTDMTNGRDALKAIKVFADYFDEHDTNVYAIHKLFSPNSMHYGPEKEQKYRQYICSMLQIKASEMQ